MYPNNKLKQQSKMQPQPTNWNVYDEIVSARLLTDTSKVNAVNEHGRTPLHQLNSLSDETIDFLLENGANIHARDNNGETPLYVAAMEGNHYALKILLTLGADPNDADTDGRTPLMLAKDAKTLEILLKVGADQEIKDNEGETAMVYHAKMKDCIQMLKKYAKN